MTKWLIGMDKKKVGFQKRKMLFHIPENKTKLKKNSAIILSSSCICVSAQGSTYNTKFKFFLLMLKQRRIVFYLIQTFQNQWTLYFIKNIRYKVNPNIIQIDIPKQVLKKSGQEGDSERDMPPSRVWRNFIEIVQSSPSLHRALLIWTKDYSLCVWTIEKYWVTFLKVAFSRNNVKNGKIKWFFQKRSFYMSQYVCMYVHTYK